MIKEIIKRTIFTPLPRHLPTTLVFFIHGGMGDRIIFQGIVKDFMARSPRRRIVAAIPSHAADYAASDYVPKPDEAWIVSSLEDQDLNKRLRIPMKIRRYADQKMFRPHKENRTYYFGICNDVSSPRLDFDGIIIREPYEYCRKYLAPKNIFPDFPIYPEARERMAEEFKTHRLERGRDPIVAVHCRQREDHALKNPRLEDFVRTVDLLKDRLKARIVLLGINDIPDELRIRASFVCPFDPSLELTAAALGLCDLFIGGDAGPGHLAAAVGLPVISIQKKSRAGHWGPFCPPYRLAYVSESSGSLREEDEIRFDPDSVVDLAQGLLERNRNSGARTASVGVKREPPPRKSFTWDRLLYIVDFLDHSNVRALSLLGPEPALQPYFIDFAIYLQKRGMRLSINTSGMIGDDKIREMARFFKEIRPGDLSFRLDIDGRAGLFGADRIRLISRFLNDFGDRTTLSLKIRDSLSGLDRALFFIEHYPLPRKIRIDLDASTSRGISGILKKLMGRAAFFRENRIVLVFEGCLPFCLFSGKELMFLCEASRGGVRFGCRTSFELTPDMKIRPCFRERIKGVSGKPLYDFNSLQEARDSFLKDSGKIKSPDLCGTGRKASCWNPCLAHLRRDPRSETLIEISGTDVY